MIDIPNQELLELLYARGYTIDIEVIDNFKFVAFNHQLALDPHKLPWSYSIGFTDEQIKLDVVNHLLAWSGLTVKYTLDY